MSFPLQSSVNSSRRPLSIHLDNSYTSHSSALHNTNDTDNLLYEVPGSPPPIPTSPTTMNGRLTSPGSPTTRSRSRSPRPMSGRTTPVPGGLNRSATPSEPAASDIDIFASYCRAWYYKQDEQAGHEMTQMLTSLPASQKAPFSRIQASIRSAYHQHVSATRTAEFLAHLSATQPGGSLMPHSRAQPDGSNAVAERKQRFDRFLRSWCTMGLPGTIPFFQGLYGIMRLQVLPEKLGGAGGSRIEWEMDDAVFMEAAGKDFMLEAIDVLKGVLGFEEVAQTRANSSISLLPGGASFPSTPELQVHGRTESHPLPNPIRKPASSTPALTRSRAPSDPFLDSHPSARNSMVPFDTPSLPEESVAPPTVPSSTPTRNLVFDEAALRIWTSPDLRNPEYLHLLKLFPTFITRSAVPRFPVTRPADLEEGFEDAKPITCGTGSMWVSAKARSDGYEGSWWSRFVMWWRTMFS
ncbi:hypothetical protein DL96DRAFT_1669581 [Flagelloscypha sp. PMI_526]|nr:hypothetical protein DL96DRAFT_1669581 [Flagelloscypha sp. PMI_526]